MYLCIRCDNEIPESHFMIQGLCWPCFESTNFQTCDACGRDMLVEDMVTKVIDGWQLILVCQECWGNEDSFCWQKEGF